MSAINMPGGARTDNDVVEHHHLLVGGIWRKRHSRNRIRVFSANTEQLIGMVPDSDAVDVDSAVQAARGAFDDPHGVAALGAGCEGRSHADAGRPDRREVRGDRPAGERSERHAALPVHGGRSERAGSDTSLAVASRLKMVGVIACFRSG
jgi:hypothetical protein